jgi:hypothetical protein
MPSQAPPRPTRPTVVNIGRRAASKPPEINAIDYQIHRQNGSTTALEFTAQRLQYSKMQTAPDLLSRVEELTKEMGRLRQEILFYRECFSILNQLRETAYDVYQQLFLSYYFDQNQDQLHRLTVQLHRGLENAMKRQAKAEKSWKDFWGIKWDQEELEGELI